MKSLLVLAVLVLACRRENPRDVVVDSTPTPTVPPAQPATKDGLIELQSPLPGALIQSPLAVTGQARGPWYFEASFPVYLLNAAGDTIARTPAQAEGEWMTTNMVPFKATITFTAPAGESGTLILSKSNASGLPEHDDELRVPVRFH